MGRRSKTETVVAIFQAFLHQRTWRQPALAEHVGIGVPALRKHLDELSKSGFPLKPKSEDPPHVSWSVPKDWYPGGVLFESKTVPDLLRMLCRLPRSSARDAFIGKILSAAPRSPAAPLEVTSVLAPPSTENEQKHLPLIEDAATNKVCLEFKYFTSSSGHLRWRRASVQKVVIGPPARFVAVCHEDGGLKWFRLDNVQNARLDTSQPFRAADAAQVDAMLSESIDGFHHGDAVHCSFFVREPDCRWVEHNLPVLMSAERVAGGMRFFTTTAGVLRLGRYVVGLGAAARAETPELTDQVLALARGALEASAGGAP